VVRERELGTLEQLMVTPLLPLELVAGKALPFALIGLVDLVLVTLLGRALVRRALQRQPAAAALRHRALPAPQPRPRPAHLDHLEDAAGSLHGELPHAGAGHPALRVHVPGR
jgi:hypothetical protein